MKNHQVVTIGSLTHAAMRPLLFTAALVLTLSASAQVADKVPNPNPAPPLETQKGGEFGTSVAVDAGYTVVGAPYEFRGGKNSGVVRVFDSATGALLFVLPNPSLVSYGWFGCAVAISGTRIVVGHPTTTKKGPMSAEPMCMI